jgi:uncharacterized membrane protein YqgA involved in biofilm formation
MLTGTIINTATVVGGSLIGLLIKYLAGRFTISPRLSALGARLQDTIMTGVALCVLFIGISGALKGENTLIAIISMALGAIIGETLDLDEKMQRLGQWIQNKSKRFVKGNSPVAEGFVTASLLFCVGAMAIVGSLENGLTGNYDTLKAKSVLDGISSIIFSSSLGIGVMFSAAAIFLYQGSISLLAGVLAPLIGSASVQNEMTCVGSMLIAALAFNMLGVTKVKVMNLVPACLMPILLCNLF